MTRMRIPVAGSDSTGTHQVRGGGSMKDMKTTDQDPLLAKIFGLLDESVPLPLTALGWGKISWCTADDLQGAEAILRERDQQHELVRHLHSIRLYMRRRGDAVRVCDLTVDELARLFR